MPENFHNVGYIMLNSMFKLNVFGLTNSIQRTKLQNYSGPDILEYTFPG